MGRVRQYLIRPFYHGHGWAISLVLTFPTRESAPGKEFKRKEERLGGEEVPPY